MMEQKNIVAIEIASSKIKGAVCNVDNDGNMTVLAVEELPATDNVRYGRVQNVQEVSSDVNEIIRKLENNPAVAPRKITGAVFPLGGRSLSGIKTSASIHFPSEIQIVDETVRRLKQEAMKDIVSRKAVEMILPRVFYVNNLQVSKPVGNFGKQLSGDFIMLACSNENRRNLERIRHDNIPDENIRYILRPVAIADFVLTDTEKQLGCVLVDFGAETTTISIYKDDSLAFLSTLPIGSRLITRDLMAGLSLTEERAEGFKTTIGNAFPESSAMVDDNPTNKEVNAYVKARAGEIAANIINQIVISGFKNADLPGGIIIVGGGAKLKNFDVLLGNQSKMQVRQGSMSPTVSFRSTGHRAHENIDVVALLAAVAADPSFADCLEEPAKTVDDNHDDAIYGYGAATTATTSAAAGSTGRTGGYDDNYDPFHGHGYTDRDKDNDKVIDDEDILKDDEDPDSEDREQHKSFIGKLFGRKKENPRADSTPEEEDEDFPDETDEDETEQPQDPEEEDNDPDTVSVKPGSLRERLARFFGSLPEDEDDNHRGPVEDD